MQLSRALAELERRSQTISDLCREAARTEEQANTLERLLTQSQRHLLEREREVAEMRLAGGRREREERGVRERLAAELAEAERLRKMAEESVRQLQVRMYMYTALLNISCSHSLHNNSHNSRLWYLRRRNRANGTVSYCKRRDRNYEQ